MSSLMLRTYKDPVIKDTDSAQSTAITFKNFVMTSPGVQHTVAMRLALESHQSIGATGFEPAT